MSDSSAQAARRILATMKASFGTTHSRAPAREEEFPHLDLSAYQAFREEMEAHGFRHLADYEVLDVTNSPGTVIARTFIRSMVSREGNVLAGYYQVKPRVWRRVKGLLTGLLNLRLIDAPAGFIQAMKTRHCVDVETEFDNGRFIVTSNAEAAAMLSQPPDLGNRYFPYGTPTGELLDVHYQRLVEVLKGGGVKPLFVATIDDMYGMQNRQAAIKSAFRASMQWVTREDLHKLSGGNAQQTDDIYAELVKARSGERDATPGGAPSGNGADAHTAANEAAEEYEEEEDTQDAPASKLGCLLFPLMLLGMVVVALVPRQLGKWLMMKGLRFMMPKEARQQMDEHEESMKEAMEEAAARPAPRRVPAPPLAARPPAAASGDAPAASEGSIAFAYDPERGEPVALVQLQSWAGYSCENSNPDYSGSRVLLRLRAANDEDSDFDHPEPAHHAAVRWLLANDQALHDSIAAALARFAPTLKARLEEYGDDESLRLLASPQGWKKLIDLSYVDVFPHTRDGMPYFAFEFECNWDPEHGFKLLANGLRVVAMDDDGYGSDDIAADGGKA